MARERMVTRTITRFNYECMGLDSVTAEVVINTFSLSEKLDNDKALKRINKLNPGTTAYAIVKSVTEETVLMGMSEVDFIAHATVLPPRTAEVNADET